MPVWASHGVPVASCELFNQTISIHTGPVAWYGHENGMDVKFLYGRFTRPYGQETVRVMKIVRGPWLDVTEAFKHIEWTLLLLHIKPEIWKLLLLHIKPEISENVEIFCNCTAVNPVLDWKSGCPQAISCCSGTDQRKHQSSAPLAFVRGIHRRSVNSLHTGSVTRKMFPFDDVIMNSSLWLLRILCRFSLLELGQSKYCLNAAELTLADNGRIVRYI